MTNINQDHKGEAGSSYAIDVFKKNQESEVKLVVLGHMFSRSAKNIVQKMLLFAEILEL